MLHSSVPPLVGGSFGFGWCATWLSFGFNFQMGHAAASPLLITSNLQIIMAFDPTLPAEGSPLVSPEMRSQLTGLESMINAVPAGPPGPEDPPGPQGPPFAGAEVESTGTLPPCNPASVSVMFDGTNVRFSFGIPQGNPGEVSFVDLNAAIGSVISGSSSVSNSVELLLPTNPNPSILDVATRLDELILTLRR